MTLRLNAVLGGAVLAMVAGISMAETCPEADTRISGYTKLSSCTLGPGRSLTIGGDNRQCVTVQVDKDFIDAQGLGKITIASNGALYVRDAVRTLEATSVIVEGKLQAGSEQCPVGTLNAANKFTLRLLGDKPVAAVAAPTHAHAATMITPKAVADDTCLSVPKGIGVMASGQLLLYGARGVAPANRDSSGIGGPNPGSLSWTYLAKPAGPAKYQDTNAKIGAPVPPLVPPNAPQELWVAADVSTNWRSGDWIVVGTTSFSPYETEFVQIDTIVAAAGGAKITLMANTPLQHYHFGSDDPGRPSSLNFLADSTKNFGVDERAEVGLVSRSITLTAKMPNYATATQAEEANLAWGGELKVCKGFEEVKLQGVEIEKFGKEQLGSYPLHLHMLGTVKANATLFNSNSIHHSYNHCVTTHMTNDVKFANNICARIVGHIFYEEKLKDPKEANKGMNIEDTGISYNDNLGLGAMSNGFGLDPTLQKVTIDGKQVFKGWWEGDYLSRLGDGYYGLFIKNTDDQTLAVTGSCFKVIADGSLNGSIPPPCKDDFIYYFEPPSGFWTVNPATVMIGNSIGGCQSIGKAFWYVPPVPNNGDREQLKFQPVGKFINNRAHACYDGVFGETDTGVRSEQLFPKKDGNLVNQNLIARFDAFTAFRIRNRGIWMRPTWFVFEHARVATSREGVSLVTSGGLDGNAPGVWGLLKNSVVVGVSTNNVDRWGPCGNANKLEGPGCVDWNKLALNLFEKGYPSPAWNFAGFYIYDGPARIHDTRFVNFRVDPRLKLLTAEDVTIQNAHTTYPNNQNTYEGDAALGWFQNNQSAYPVATETRGLVWDGVDLRHQVFTEKVNFGNFDDGDKNTAIIDRDGSLTGFKVVNGAGAAAPDDYPISLNNLPINASSNAVDECLSEGAQDKINEGRPTSLISPGNMGTLEFEAFTLPNGVVPSPPPPDQPDTNKLTQFVTFTKDTKDYGVHQTMTLHSRNNQGIWEPKVTSGLGYTVTAKASPSFPNARPLAGFPRLISVGVVDVVKPRISKTNPFYTRVGVCYTNVDGSHPDGDFLIKRGYRSWGGNGTEINGDKQMLKLFNYLDLRYKGQRCFNLAAQNPQILNDEAVGCPANGIISVPDTRTCPEGSDPGKDVNNLDVCAYRVTTLAKAASWAAFQPVNGVPPDTYFYDKVTGMLFFYVKQDRPNAKGTSPLGSCTNGATDPACPNPNDATFPEHYYTCPPEGCITYTVKLPASVPYNPGPSACVSSDPTAIYTYNNGIYEQAKPTGVNQLAYKPAPNGVTPDGVVVPIVVTNPLGFPHSEAGFGLQPVPVKPVCTGTPS